MQYKKHTLSLGKEIHIFDGLVPFQLRDHLFTFISNSKYVIGWADNNTQTATAHRYLHSQYSFEDDRNAGLLPFLENTPVKDLINGLEHTKSIVNLSVPSDTHFAHAHPEKVVVLYYANLGWEQHWYGETLFYTEDLSEIELAIRYTPGRVVVFDASIPHAVRPQSTSADHYRFTYAMIFD